MDTDQLLVPSSLLHAQISMAFLIFANFVVNAVEAQMRPNPAKEVPSILNKVRSMKFCPFHCCGGNVDLRSCCEVLRCRRVVQEDTEIVMIFKVIDDIFTWLFAFELAINLYANLVKVLYTLLAF
jgi:hypothetical protein